jgi:hypothetical protein
MTFTVMSPPQVIPPTRSRNPPDCGSARPATITPAYAEHQNTVPSTQNPDRARSPINNNQLPIDHPMFRPIRHIENPSAATLKSP